jgi:hypothetical protein
MQWELGALTKNGKTLGVRPFYSGDPDVISEHVAVLMVHVQIVSAQIVSAQFVSAQIVSAQIVSDKLYREHIVSGTNCIGNKLYREQTVSAPFHFFTLSFYS